MSQFCHLHCHSEYSLLDGMSRLEDMVKRAKALNQPAIALTDHGVMFGAIEFYRAAKKHDVKPIMGVEAYLAPRGMNDRDPQLDRQRYHMLLLAENFQGYQNLLHLSSVAQLEGFYGRPRIDKAALAAHSEGIIATTGCLAAEVPRTLINKGEQAAYESLKWYLDLFGRDRFFLELQPHDIPELRQVNGVLLNWARKHQIGLVATNDVHYVRKEDADPHDVLLCIQTRESLANPNRMTLSPKGSYYITSDEEMSELFRGLDEALIRESFHNTLMIAERCNVSLEHDGYHLPNFPLPAGKDAEAYLRELVEKGLTERYGPRRPREDAELRERVERELSVIHNMGFDTYFLVVWDICDYAAKNDIWWNVRGSGAGSVVAYALRITNIDPIKNDLIFERFLNPARTSMPDIDIDFPDDRRSEMIEYTVQRYGSDKVAAIITFGTLGARAAVRDVGRVFDMPLTEVDRVARIVPNVPGKPVTLEGLLTEEKVQAEWPVESAELLRVYEQEPEVRSLLDTAMKLEGQTRHASTHAAGIVLTDRPIVEYAPLHRPTKGDDSGPIQQVVQFDMGIVESIGLLKVDFLGLATLSIMRRACELIEERHGIALDLNTIPYERDHADAEADKPIREAFELIQSGRTVGIFQVEGAGMRRMLQEMRPSEFEHIIAAISLYRPGPMEQIPNYIARMHGNQAEEYLHPILKPILKNTYAIIVYQEQIMRIAVEVAGYTEAEADLMRRAVSKKKEKEIERHKAIFVKGAQERGIAQGTAEKIYGQIEYFARYGFNKAHAADYAVITVQTAYLKRHYPVEYLCAMLEVEFDDSAKVPVFITECRRLGIDVLPPDINRSGAKFAIEPNPAHSDLPESDHRHWAIRVGLGTIKNVGLGAVEMVLAEREANGPFASLDDFCERVDLRQMNRRVLECLAKVGSFDGLASTVVAENPRETVLAILDRMMGISGQTHEAADVGQISMFELLGGVGMQARNSVLSPLPALGHVNPKQRLMDEKELLGVYLSDHPLQQVAEEVGRRVTCFCGEIGQEHVQQQVVIAGLLTSIRTITTKKGDPMAFIKLEDLQGTIEAVIFPRTYEQARELLVEDAILLVRGKVEERDDRYSLLADVVRLYEPNQEQDEEESLLSPFQFQPSAPPPMPEAPPPAPPTEGALLDAMTYQVTLSLHHTANATQDVARLQRAINALRGNPGSDSVQLRYNSADRGTVLINFPKLSINWNAHLRSELARVGIESHVKDLTPDNSRRWKR
ncbi:MAG: DNA polymerase III subunit alpha [Anaerolineales bacterium]|nr:DNA polymerase III subunit alpha [Anaerolineales bacterium]MCB9128177.1 DNA polymerase III subunit alpha [Ardenticatenales bacterium]MCB9171886.1 DNA polymerase III subunit alpha [Ardenticatenales bacterium]